MPGEPGTPTFDVIKMPYAVCQMNCVLQVQFWLAEPLVGQRQGSEDGVGSGRLGLLEFLAPPRWGRGVSTVHAGFCAGGALLMA